MKKSFILLSVLLILCLSFTFLTACSSGDELVGTWEELNEFQGSYGYWIFLEDGNIHFQRVSTGDIDTNTYFTWEYSKEDKCYYIIWGKDAFDVTYKVVFSKDKKSFNLILMPIEYSVGKDLEASTFTKK